MSACGRLSTFTEEDDTIPATGRNRPQTSPEWRSAGKERGGRVNTSGMDGRQLLEERARRIQHDERTTMEMDLLCLLADEQWHSSRELALKTSHRFGAYLWTLHHKHGVQYEVEEDATAPRGRRWYRYRLTSLDGAVAPGTLF